MGEQATTQADIVCPYGFGRRIAGTLEDAVAKVTNALKNEGFGVLTEINVKDTLKKKLDVDFRGYLILGACNPPLAHQALSAEPQIGLLLPCNVVVQEAPEGGGIVVTIADPRARCSRLSAVPGLNRSLPTLNAAFGVSCSRWPEDAGHHTSDCWSN